MEKNNSAQFAPDGDARMLIRKFRTSGKYRKTIGTSFEYPGSLIFNAVAVLSG